MWRSGVLVNRTWRLKGFGFWALRLMGGKVFCEIRTNAFAGTSDQNYSIIRHVAAIPSLQQFVKYGLQNRGITLRAEQFVNASLAVLTEISTQFFRANCITVSSAACGVRGKRAACGFRWR